MGTRKKRGYCAVSTIIVLPLDNVIANILFWIGETLLVTVQTGRIEGQSAGSYLDRYSNGPLLSGNIHSAVVIMVRRDWSLGGINETVQRMW